MPHSVEHGKMESISFIRGNIPTTAPILDVGAGAGVYARRLRPLCYEHIDAVEIHRAYLDDFQLAEIYKTVFVEDVRTFTPPHDYGLIIFGDILEHLTVADAQATLARLKPRCQWLLISVPWMFEQDAIGGNTHERHLQPDLTPAVFAERYPGMTQMFNSDILGVYYARGGL